MWQRFGLDPDPDQKGRSGTVANPTLKLSSEWLPPRTGPPRPCRIPNHKLPRSANAMYKAAFWEQKCSPIMVSMTTYCDAYVLDMDQWYTAHAWCNWRLFYHLGMVTSERYGNRWVWHCQQQNLTSLSKDETKSMGRLRFSHHYPNQFGWWSHQDSTFLQTKLLLNRIGCLIRDYNYNPESHFQFGDPTHSATSPGLQFTMNMMEKSLMELRMFKERDSHVWTTTSYDQSKPTER